MLDTSETNEILNYPISKKRKDANVHLTTSEPPHVPDILEERSSGYDPLISRKMMERITNLSTPTIVKYEQDGTIFPRKVKRGGQEIVSYSIKDVHAIFKKRGVRYNDKNVAEVISIFNQKGGTGKSAFTQHLGAMLALVAPKGVLIIDMDSQADATSLFGINADHSDLVADDQLAPSIMELINWSMKDGSDPDVTSLPFEEVVRKVSPSIDIIPSDLDISDINYRLNRLPISDRFNPEGELVPGALYVVKEVVEKVRHLYDFILFDLPPNIETANVASLFASNRILIPLELEAKCLKTMSRNEDFLSRLVGSGAGFHFEQILLVPNKFQPTNIKIKALAKIQDLYSDRRDIMLSEVVVPTATIIDRCSESKEPIFVAATKTGKEFKNDVAKAKEFSDMFWIILHEILNVETKTLLFADMSGEAAQ